MFRTLLLSAALITAPALAAWFTGEGEFRFPHQIAFMSYADEAACKADEGRWEEDLCWFDASDDVNVRRAANGIYTVEVTTVTTNAHTCDFEGQGEFTNEGTILARAASERWSDERQEWEAGECRVTLSYLDGDTVDVTPEGDCSYFCGMRAGLEIRGAKRR